MLRVQNQPASSSIHCAQLKTPTHEAKTNTAPPTQKKPAGATATCPLRRRSELRLGCQVVNSPLHHKSRHSPSWMGFGPRHFSVCSDYSSSLFDQGEGQTAIMHKRRVVVGEPRPPFKGAARLKHARRTAEGVMRGRVT